MSNEKKTVLKLRIQQALLVALLGLMALGGFHLFSNIKKTLLTPTRPAPVRSPSDLPEYTKVMDILRPLEYSGVADLIKPTTELKIDFQNRTWTLTNIHDFDPQGHIRLEQDRYGLCGELAAHVYKKIAPLLGDRYEVFFLKATESAFFLRPRTSHIVLLLVDRSNRERFFIDPSFGRYGRETDFRDYLFAESADYATHLRSLTPDVLFSADVETPLMIRKDHLLCLGAESVDGKFDKDHFALAITANKRHDFSGPYIFVLRRQGGKTETIRDDRFLANLLTPAEIQKICGKVTEWFEAASQSS